MNSVPDLVRLFLRWLALLGYGADRLKYRIHIHEKADVVAARERWARVVGVPPSEFTVTLKRHNPKTVRKNVGPAYHGCLVVRVTRSTQLGRQIAGWWQGIVAASAPVS